MGQDHPSPRAGRAHTGRDGQYVRPGPAQTRAPGGTTAGTHPARQLRRARGYRATTLGHTRARVAAAGTSPAAAYAGPKRQGSTRGAN
eukprot:5935679-Lingulodinium_polyedra.AAC.1